MSSKTATIRFKNGEKWENFLEEIEKNNGTTRGHIGTTVETLIDIYIKYPDITVEKLVELEKKNEKSLKKINKLENDITNNNSEEIEKTNKELENQIEEEKKEYLELQNNYEKIRLMNNDLEEKNKELQEETFKLQKENIELTSKLEYPERENKLLQKN